MNVYGAPEEWDWKGKTEVLGENIFPNAISLKMTPKIVEISVAFKLANKWRFIGELKNNEHIIMLFKTYASHRVWIYKACPNESGTEVGAP